MNPNEAVQPGQPAASGPSATPGAMRDQRIDFWRGLCVLGMALWHMLSHESFPRWFSFPVIQGLNFVAEGFVLISGLCVGLGVSRLQPGSLRMGHYLRRAASILLLHYLVVGVLLAAAWTGLIQIPYQPKDFLDKRSLWEHLWAVATLSEQFYLADILSVFFFLFLTTPIFLWIFWKAGPGGLLGICLFLYLATLSLAWLGPDWHRRLELNSAGAFDWNTWQFVYATGIVLGLWYRRWGDAMSVQTARKAFGWVLLAWLLVAGVYLALKLRFPSEHLVQKLLLGSASAGASSARLCGVAIRSHRLGLPRLVEWFGHSSAQPMASSGWPT